MSLWGIAKLGNDIDALREELRLEREAADAKYKRLAREAEDLLSAAGASGAAAIFTEAAERGLYG